MPSTMGSSSVGWLVAPSVVSGGTYLSEGASNLSVATGTEVCRKFQAQLQRTQDHRLDPCIHFTQALLADLRCPCTQVEATEGRRRGGDEGGSCGAGGGAGGAVNKKAAAAGLTLQSSFAAAAARADGVDPRKKVNTPTLDIRFLLLCTKWLFALAQTWSQVSAPCCIRRRQMVLPGVTPLRSTPPVAVARPSCFNSVTQTLPQYRITRWPGLARASASWRRARRSPRWTVHPAAAA